MSLKIKDISILEYERVIHATNETTSLNCIIAIHNTKLGPALGGVRSWPYNNFEEHLNDALRLSKAMSLKNSVCGINFGGGKAVINLKGKKKTPDLYESYGELVDKLNNKYIIEIITNATDNIFCLLYFSFKNNIPKKTLKIGIIK